MTTFTVIFVFLAIIIIFIVPCIASGILMRIIFKSARGDLLALLTALLMLIANDSLEIFPHSTSSHSFSVIIDSLQRANISADLPAPLLIFAIIILDIFARIVFPFILIREGIHLVDLHRINKKFKPQQGVAGYPPQGVGSPER